MNRLHFMVPMALLAGVHIHAVGASYLGREAQAQEIVWLRDLDTATSIAVDSSRPLLVVFR